VNTQIALPGVTGLQKVELSQWFTPRETAKRIVGFARIEDGDSVLEPSCGRGALLEWIAGDTSLRLFGVDIDPENAVYCSERDWSVGAQKFVCGDFLSMVPCAEFDLAILNPPFEDGQAEAHIMQALKWARRVVCHCPLTTLASVERREGLWEKVDLTRLAICSSRPKYGAKGGATDMMTVEVLTRDPRLERVETTVEWWP
jgi:hypothetical protein